MVEQYQQPLQTPEKQEKQFAAPVFADFLNKIQRLLGRVAQPVLQAAKGMIGISAHKALPHTIHMRKK